MRERVAVLETKLTHVSGELRDLKKTHGESTALINDQLKQVRSLAEETQAIGKALVKFTCAAFLMYWSGGSDSEAFAGALRTLFPALFGGSL